MQINNTYVWARNPQNRGALMGETWRVGGGWFINKKLICFAPEHGNLINRAHKPPTSEKYKIDR